MAFLIALLILLSSMTFTLGITLPIVKFESFYFFDETTSIVEIVVTLFTSGEFLLAILVAAFSIIFPIIKQVAVIFEAIGNQRESNLIISKFVPLLSKWSMMDVLLVALVIVAAKISGVASAFSQSGLWFYACSTLLTIISHWLIHKKAHSEN